MIEIVQATHFSFSSGGREDIDVWMLGNGRPFLIELHNPKRSISGVKDIENFKSAI